MPWVWSAVCWRSRWLVTGDLLNRVAGVAGFFHPLLLGSLWVKLLVTRSVSRWGRPRVGLWAVFLTNVNMITSWYVYLLCSRQQKDVKSRIGACNRISVLYWRIFCKWGFLTIKEFKGLFKLVDSNTVFLEHRKWLLQKGFSCRLDQGQVGWFCSQILLILLGAFLHYQWIEVAHLVETSVYVEVGS